jgi:hypothetical protein
VDTQKFDFASAPKVFDLVDMDAQMVKTELSTIRDAADSIAGRMAKQLEVASKAARNQEAR